MIQHVTREVPPDMVARCVAFYALIGFTEVPAPPGIVGRAVWLQSRGPTPSQFHLMPKTRPAPATGHVGVLAAEYEAAVARLRAEGHSVEPRREHWGRRAATSVTPPATLWS